MNQLTLLVIAALLLVVRAAWAEPFEDGVTAHERGDYATALRLWRPLAEQGSSGAQFNLGVMYSEGKGVTQDLPQAAKWLRLAANQGLASAQFNLGNMYRAGEGVTQDYAEAIKWFRLAAIQEDSAAQFTLGNMYLRGVGVVQNYAESLRWFRLAANQALAEAQDGLGRMYARGQGVAKDNVIAHMWVNLAAMNGLDSAAKLRKLIENTLTPDQIARAQEMANQCVTSRYMSCGGQQSPEVAVTAPSPSKRSQAGPSSTKSSSRLAIPLAKQGGTFVVPILINNAITLQFIVDSGAADVSIPADVVSTLMRTGTLKQSDFLGKRTYVLADGSKVPSQTFRIRSMKVGDRTIENITGSVAPQAGPLLLGQSFLSRFRSWSMDNDKHVLLLE